MAKRAMCSRIVQVAQRAPGVEIRTNKHSILPNPCVSEVADAVKFLVHFKWPTILSPGLASHTLCTMLPCLHQSHSHPSSSERLETNMYKSVSDTWDWQKSRTEIRTGWRQSGVTPRELLRLVHLIKEGGLTPDRDEYSRLLQVCMCLCEREGLREAGLHSAVREMVRKIRDDLGTGTTGSVLMSSILPLASSQAQALRMWKNLSGDKSKESSLHLLEAYLWFAEDSRAAVSTLNTQIVPNHVPLSAHTLERVILLCIKQKNLSNAVGTYSCMTRRYGIAPSKEVYTKLTRVLPATSESDNVSESLCYRILTDTKAVFGGSPPLWVYTLMSKPLLILRGLQGYRDMYQLSSKAALERCQFHSREATALMQQSWEPSIYHSLIYRCSHFLSDGASMALKLYREMVAQGGSNTEETFELLLRVAHKREDLNSYITPLLFDMRNLSKEHMVQLRDPLVQALGRIYDFHTEGLTHSRSKGWHSSSNQGTPKFISLAGQLLVCDTLRLADSHQHCLDQLASLNSQHRHNALNSPVHTSDVALSLSS